MTKVILVANHNHAAVTSHLSSGFIQFDDKTELHFISLTSQKDEQFCAHTEQNGKIIFPIERIWAIQYG
jgi:hypothetical protein